MYQNMKDTLESNLPAEGDKSEDIIIPVKTEVDDVAKEPAEEVTPEVETTAEEVIPETEATVEEATPEVEVPAEEVIPETEATVEEATPEAEAPTEEVIPETEATVEEATPEMEVPAEEAIQETEATVEEVIPEAVPEQESSGDAKEKILVRLSGLIETFVEKSRDEIEFLKQSYYKIRRSETDELKKAFLEQGGEEPDFVAPEDETETRLKELLAAYKTKRAALHAEEERIKEANYALKLQMIEQLKALTESQDDFNKLYNEFKEIQQRWKELKQVPQEHANELWRSYQIYSEKFYDLIKINALLRDYDFKKNLELKTVLCETVEKLENEPDVVSAFHQLQKLHQQWRETGPVAKELREEIWTRFKTASTTVNKRHQEHFEKQKDREQENLQAKTALCEAVEAIDFASLKTFRDWDEKNKEIIRLQQKWKTLGFAPKKFNVKIFERFRSACDTYFNKKTEFYKTVKGEMEKNFEQKKALCEQAEALKESTDWKTVTDKMITLQKEWKKVGPVGHKYSDAIWKRFISACDYFFEQKNKSTSSQKGTEQANLAAKKSLIEKINRLESTKPETEALSLLRKYITEWNAVGFVPFKEKDRIHKEFREAVDKQFDRLQIDNSDRKMQSFRENVSSWASGENKNKIYNERDRLMRIYDRMKSELQTYENNIGFFSISSKGGGGLVKEMEHKMEKLREEMELTVKKIEAIDNTIDN
jgi:hypothetical protein